MAGPLAGIRVLDLGTRIGAPFAATLLADFGAEVIKVELPGQGDFLRTIGPFEERVVNRQAAISALGFSLQQQRAEMACAIL